jgi:hypothetical protein
MDGCEYRDILTPPTSRALNLRLGSGNSGCNSNAIRSPAGLLGKGYKIRERPSLNLTSFATGWFDSDHCSFDPLLMLAKE